jgi:hypothetical protein
MADNSSSMDFMSEQEDREVGENLTVLSEIAFSF